MRLDPGKSITVEVAYALPERQVVLKLESLPEVSAEQAIQASGVLREFPEIDLATAQIGIYGKPCEMSTLLRDGDRVEIYRALINDPRDARRHRASTQSLRTKAVTPRRRP